MSCVFYYPFNLRALTIFVSAQLRFIVENNVPPTIKLNFIIIFIKNVPKFLHLLLQQT